MANSHTLQHEFMSHPAYYSILLALLIALMLVFLAVGFKSSAQLAAQASSAQAANEEAYRANNTGVALMDQFKYKEAAEAFRRALQLDPKLALARINLGIALFNLPDLAGAQREAQSAAALVPDAPQPLYIQGLIAKTQNRADVALSAFERVLKIDPADVGANINLGQLYLQGRNYTEAIKAFRAALAAEPYNGTALYNLGTALLRAGQREEGQRVIARFQELRQRGGGTTLGQNYLEQGRYAEAVASTGAEPELVESALPSAAFTDATQDILSGSTIRTNEGSTATASSQILGRRFSAGEFSDASRREIAAALGGSATLFDFDSDGDLDLFWTRLSEQHLYRNENGHLTEVTSQAGALGAKFVGIALGAVAGDYDNDNRADLFVVRDRGLALYHNDGSGKFSDVTAAAALPPYPYLASAVAFVDTDHDGDLDICITGLADLTNAPAGEAVFPDDFAGAPIMLLRNDGNGKFTDVASAAKLDKKGHALALVPTDFNNRRDIDLLVVNYGASPDLYSNQRDGTFRNVTSEVGLGENGRWTCAAAGDVNKDGYTDFFFGRRDGPGLFALSDGREKFKKMAAPLGADGTSATQFLDYDNDGLLDCVLLTDKGIRVWRGVGFGGWTQASERAVTSSLAGLMDGASRLLSAGDIDNDGDTDLLVLSADGGLRVARNDGGSNRSLKVNLTGKVSNRSGVGAKVEMRAGSLRQKLESYSVSPAPAPADIIFGLGKRSAADAVRVLWPAGIVQAEIEAAQTAARPVGTRAATAMTLGVIELDRKPSSCPFLYAWNGERFEFVTDFMGGGEMGHWEAPGQFNQPDPDEYVRLRSDQLREHDGLYELRITNELEEALFVDRLQLIAVAHPLGVEVYPNEGLSASPRPFLLYTTKGARPPAGAFDEHGHDVLARIRELDRQYPDDFRREPIRGYAAEHQLTLNLGKASNTTERTLLLLTGWTDYAWSSDNVAASQGGKSMRMPALQVKDRRGRWRTVIEDIGIPVGRPQTVTVDLTGKFLSASREVRILTNMRVLWDQILVDTSSGDCAVELTRLDPAVSRLRWRGFSREVTPDGREPFGYDYEQISFNSPWKAIPGRYTREGDVRELLLKSDDMFVISRPGDEIILSFNADQLPTLPQGWTRTFLLYADGFSKEMDINSASPDQLLPLPFHGMTKYPYATPEAYPMTEARRAYIERYNTRVVTSEVSSIDSLLIDLGEFGAFAEPIIRRTKREGDD